MAQRTLYWSGTTGTTAPLWTTLGAWSTIPGGWSPPTALPGPADTVVFSLASLLDAQSVSLDGDQSALGLLFSSTAATSILGGSPASPAINTLTLGAGGITLARGAGPVTIGSGGVDNVGIILGDSQTWSTASGTRLAVLGGVTGAAGVAETLTFGGYGMTSVAGPIADGASGGTVSLVKTGYGSVRLSGANTYSGPTSISNGTLLITSAAALGTASSTVTVTGVGERRAASGTASGALFLDGLQSGITLSRNLSLQGLGANAVTGNQQWFGAALASIGNNTLAGSIATGTGNQATQIASTFGTLSLTGTLAVGGAANGTVTTLGAGFQAGAGSYALTGVLSGSGVLNKYGTGMLHLNPSSSADFTGSIRVQTSAGSSATGQSSVRITQNGVIGSRVGSGVGSQLDFRGGILEVRMDTPLVQGSGTAAGVDANFYNGSGTLFVDHAIGSMATSGTLTLGDTLQGAQTSFTFNGRNGYGVNVGSWAVVAGNASNFTNNLGGLLTLSGSFWNMVDTGTTRLYTIQGTGNTLITGDIIANGGASFDHVFTKAGAGLLTITSTGATLDGNVFINVGGLQITEFRSLNNVSGTIALGSSSNPGSLIIGTSIAPSGAAALTSQRTIDLAGTTAGGSIYANQTGPHPVVFGSNIAVSGSGAKTLVLAGTSTLDNAFNGVIIDGTFAGNAVSVTKQGSGTWLLGGANTYTGATTISNGTLKLRANAATSTILADSGTLSFNAVNQFAGGTLEFVGQASTNNVEAIGQLLPTQGANTIRLTPGAGGNASLVFSSTGAFGKGATVNVVGSTATSTVTLTGVATGLASPAIYFSGSNFAYSSSGVLRAPVYDTDAGFVTAPAATALPAGQSNFDVTGDITAQPSTTVSTLRFAGSSTLTLAPSQVLAIRTAAAGTDGGILATGGTSTIAGGTVTTGGAGTLFVRVDGGSDQFTLGSALPAAFTGGLTKSGAGLLVLSGSNLQVTGATSINEGTLRLSGASSRLSGANVPTNIRQAATLDLNGVSTDTAIGQFNNNGTVTNSSAMAATLVVGNGNNTGASYGVMQDGAGVLNVTKVGTGNQSWLGTSTYTGVTRIGSSGVVTVDVLADIGVASGIGRGDATSTATNAASLVFDGSTGGLVYQGNLTSLTQGAVAFGSQQAATNRLFTLAGTGVTISSNASNSNAIIWTNTSPIVFGTSAAQTIIFGGNSTGDNTFRPRIEDNTISGSATSVTKSNAGIWLLDNAANSYTGPTTIQDGNLAAASAGSIPATSPLVVGASTGLGVLLTSGEFTRPLAAAAVPGSATVTFAGTTGGGGFAAQTDKLVVAIGGTASPTALVWGGGTGFLPSGAQFVLGSSIGLAEVEVRNPIDLNGAARTINVIDNPNTGADFATLSGPISGAGGLVKNSTGILALTGANTYSGTTSVTAGMITVTSLGSSAAPGLASSLGISTGANLNANALLLGNATTTGGILQYIGPGETSDRKIRLNTTTAEIQFHADGSGPLVLTNVANDLGAGAKTLRLRGLNTDRNEISNTLADNVGALAVVIDGAATWVLSGSNSFTGGVTVGGGGGMLGIGNNFALGATSGTFTMSSGGFFAAGGARSVANPVVWGNNTQINFAGDYDLTFTGSVAFQIAANNNNIYNNAAPGTTLTFNRFTADSLAAGNLIVNGGGDTTIGSVTSTTANGLPIIKNGTGTLTLGTGTEASFFGNRAALTVTAGTVNIRVPVVANLVSLSSGTISGTSTLDGTGYTITNASGTTAIAARLVGSGTLAKSGAGTLVLTGSNTYSGATSITNGILQLGDGGSTGSLSPASAIAISSGKTLAFNRSDDYGGSFANAISGAGGIRLAAGQLTLSASNAYTGPTTVAGGTLTIANQNAVSASTLTLASGGVAFSGGTAFTLGGLSGSAGSVLALQNTSSAPITLSLTTAGTFAGSFTGSGTLAQLSGTQTLSGTAAIGSAVTIGMAGGGLSYLFDGPGSSQPQTLASPQSVAVTQSGTLTVNRAGTIALNQTLGLSRLSLGGQSFTVANTNGYGLAVTGTTTLSASGTIGVATASISSVVQGLTLAGPVVGSGLTKVGNGTLVLSNTANSFTGNLNVTAGYLAATSDAAFGNAANQIVLAANAGLRANDSFSTGRTISLVSGTNNVQVVQGSTLTFTGSLANASATSQLVLSDNGVLEFAAAGPAGWTGSITAPGAAAQVLTGGLLVNSGVVRLSDSAALGATTNIVAINAPATNNSQGVAVQLAGGITLPNRIVTNVNTNGSDWRNAGTGGLGLLQSVSGSNRVTGLVSSNFTANLGAAAGATLDLAGGVTVRNGSGGQLGLLGDGNILLSGGTVSSVNGIYKWGSGTTTITTVIESSTANGIRSFGGGGVLSLAGSGSAAASIQANIFYRGDTLRLDNAGTNVVNRLGGSTSPLSLQGGALEFIANASAPSSESIGVFRNLVGDGQIRMVTSGQDATLTFASLNGNGLDGGSSLSFRTAGTSADFGTPANRVLSTTAPTLTNGILPRGFVYDSNGVNFATYVSGTGFVAFTGYTTDFAAAGSTSNVRLDASAAVPTVATRSVNSIKLPGGVTLSGSNLAFTPTQGLLATGGTSTIAAGLNVTVANNTDMSISVDAGSTLQVDGVLSGVGGAYLTKNLGGTLVLGGRQYISSGNVLYLNGGTLRLAGGDQTLYQAPDVVSRWLSVGAGATLDLDGNNQLFTGLRYVSNDQVPYDGVVTSAAPATLAVRLGGNENFGGRITGAVTLVQATNGNRNWLNDNSFTGRMAVVGGSGQLVDYGRISQASAIDLVYGQLSITNSGMIDLTDRVSDTAPITLRGGRIDFSGRAATNSTETLGPLLLAGGYNLVRVQNGNVGVVNSAELTFASLSRPEGSSATLNVNRLGGSNPGLGLIGNNFRVFFTSAPSLTNNILGGWAISDREFASYVPGMGVGGLNTAGFPGYSTATLATSGSADNVRITAGTTLVTNATAFTFNMNFGGTGGTVALGGNTLTLTGGGLMFGPTADNAVITLSGGAITAGTAGSGGDLYVHHMPVGGTGRLAVISGTFADNAGGPVRLVLDSSEAPTSANTISLSAANTHTGGTVINGAPVVLAGSPGTVVIPAAGGLRIAQGSLTMLANAGQIASGVNPVIEGGATLTLAGDNTLAGLTFDNLGAGVTNVTPTVTTNGVLTLTGGITATSQNPVTFATINGTLDFGGAARTISVAPISYAGEVIAETSPTLQMNALVQNAGQLSVTGGGVLLLSSSNSTFSGGYAVAANTALTFGTNSVMSGDTVVAGPLGTGTLSLASGARLFSYNAATTQANSVEAAGDIRFEGVQNLTLSGPLALVGSGSYSVDAPLTTITLSGPISGAAGFTKTGYGILAVTGTNAFDGGVTLASGRLSLGSATALGSGTFTITGGVLDSTVANLAVSTANAQAWNGGFGFLGTQSLDMGTGGVALGNPVTVNVQANTLSVGGLADGGAGHGLTKTGNGTLSINAASSLNGPVTVSSGTLRLGGASGSLGAASGVTVDGGARLAFASTGDYGGPVTSTISGAGSLLISSGTLTLTGANTYSGTTTLSGGQLRVSTIGNAGSPSSLGTSGTLPLNTTAPLVYIGTGEDTDKVVDLVGTTTGGVIDNSGSGLLRFTSNLVASGAGSKVLSLQGSTSGTGEFAGVILDNSATNRTGITKLGNGTWVLSGANTYTGVTTINGGVLSVATIGDGGVAGNLGQAASAPANLVLGGGTLRYTGVTAATNRSFTLTNSTTSSIDVSEAGTTLTLSGTTTAANAAAAFVKSGPGTLVLSSSNPFLGTTRVSNGTLRLGNAAALGSSTFDTQSGAAGTLSFGTLTSATFGGLVGANAFALNNDSAQPVAFTVGNGNVSSIYDGILSGGAGLTKIGTGTFALSGVNTYSGTTTLTAGVLSISADANLGSPSSGLALNGGTLRVTGTESPTINAGRPISLTVASTINVVEQANVLTIPSFPAAGTGFTKTGPGTLALSGNLATSSGIAVSGGRLTSSGSLTITGNSTVGTSAGTVGVIRQTSGTVGTAVNSNLMTLGGGGTGFGAYELVAGSSTNAYWEIGNSGFGIATVSGGTLAAGQYLMVGRRANGTGVLTVGGGGGSAAVIGGVNSSGVSLNWNDGGVSNVRSELNILAGGVVSGGASAAYSLNYRAGGTGVVGVANLLAGGTLSVGSVNIAAGSPTAIFNFNGGVLQATQSLGTFMQGLSTANVFPGGAVIDTNGFTTTIAQNLVAPAGSGVSDLVISGSGYLTAPYVQITGDGVGATAIAAIDGSGTITGFTITNPGTGYTTSPTVALVGGGGTGSATASIAANTSGGLTKTNAGTLVLSGNNTFTGTTTVQSGTLQIGSGSTTGSLAASVPVVLGSGAMLVFNRSNDYGDFPNAISGPGGLRVTSGTFTLSGSNGYSQGTMLAGGRLNLGDPSAIGSGTLSFAGGVLGNTSAGDITLANPLVFNGVGGLAGPQNVTLLGPGSITANTSLAVTSGTLAVGGVVAENAAGRTLAKTGAGTLAITGSWNSTGNATVSGGRLAVSGSFGTGGGQINVATAASNVGMMLVPAGGLVTMGTGNNVNLNIGTTAGAAGSVVIAGGSVVLTPQSASGINMGVGGYGGLHVTSGSLTLPRIDTNNSTAAGAAAVVRLDGGLMTMTESVFLRTTRSDITVTGGTMARQAATGGINMGWSGTGNVSVFSVAGGLVNNGPRSISLGNSGTTTNIVNLAAGELVTASFTNGANANTTSVINFNGGTLRPSGASASFIPTTNGLAGYVNGPFGSFAGGAVFDTPFNVTVALDLRAPTGDGLSGLTLGSAGSGYIGAPYVEITGGGGSGATGYATVDLDPESATFGRLTGVVLTNPGIGYTDPGSIVVNLIGGGGSGGSVSAAGLVANTSGGLTKTGAATLTLSGSNTFSGPTLVSAGTLALANVNALMNSPLTVSPGAAVAFTVAGTNTYTLGSLSGSSTLALGPNTISVGADDASTAFAGTISGSGGLTKTGTGDLALSGSSSYTGVTQINGGSVTVASLPAGGGPGPFGAGANAAANLVIDGAALRYVGAGETSLRAFTIGTGGATIEAASSGPLVLSGEIALAGSNVARTLALTGTSAADNRLATVLGNNGSGQTSLAKTGVGRWVLDQANTFSGQLSVLDGELVVGANVDLTGASPLGTSSSDPVVGSGAAGATGDASLLLASGVSLNRPIAVPALGAGAAQRVILGGMATSGTARFLYDANMKLDRDVTLQAGTGSVVEFGNLWSDPSGSDDPTVSLRIGTAGNAGTVVLSPGNSGDYAGFSASYLSTTGSLDVDHGVLKVAQDYVVTLGGPLTVNSGATLAGSGTIAALLAGSGLVGPGSSPGILTSEAVDPAGGLDFAFEFTGFAPDYSAASASVNDLIRLTGTNPFTGALTSGNLIDVYFPASAAGGQTYLGGFFTDLEEANLPNFAELVGDATFQYYVADAQGTVVYNGLNYSLLDLSSVNVNVGVTTVASASFASGVVTGGQITQFVIVVPEPAAIALAAIGIAAAARLFRRRAR